MRKGLEILLAGILAVSTPNLVMGQQLASTQNTEQQAQDSRRALLYQIQQLEQEAKQKPTSELYEKISDSYLELKDFENAIETAKHSSRLNPKRWEPNLNISTGYIKLKNFSKALVYARKAYDLSKNPKTCLNMSVTYSNIGNQTEALRYVEEALGIDPNYEKAKTGKEIVLRLIKRSQ